MKLQVISAKVYEIIVDVLYYRHIRNHYHM